MQSTETSDEVAETPEGNSDVNENMFSEQNTCQAPLAEDDEGAMNPQPA